MCMCIAGTTSGQYVFQKNPEDQSCPHLHQLLLTTGQFQETNPPADLQARWVWVVQPPSSFLNAPSNGLR